MRPKTKDKKYKKAKICKNILNLYLLNREGRQLFGSFNLFPKISVLSVIFIFQEGEEKTNWHWVVLMLKVPPNGFIERETT